MFKKVRFDSWLNSATHLWHQLQDKMDKTNKQTKTKKITFNNSYSFYSGKQNTALTERNNVDHVCVSHSDSK